MPARGRLWRCVSDGVRKKKKKVLSEGNKDPEEKKLGRASLFTFEKKKKKQIEAWRSAKAALRPPSFRLLRVFPRRQGKEAASR